MYVYIKGWQEEGRWLVGFYMTKYSHDGKPYNEFITESEWINQKEAAARVNYLNGGTGDTQVRPNAYADAWRNPYKAQHYGA